MGNNALICAALGLERAEPFGEHRGRTVGFVGRSAEGIAFDDLRGRCARAFGQEPFAWDTGPEIVHSVGIVSGAAASSFGEAIAKGLDAFLTGEPAEHVMADARESGTHFIAGGHYATETFGVRRLGELLGERFGVEHRLRGSSEPDLSPQIAESCLRRPAQPIPSGRRSAKRRGGQRYMAIHLTPTELGREAGMHRREVISRCMEMGVPIFQGRIDKTLFLCSLKEANQKRELAKA